MPKAKDEWSHALAIAIMREMERQQRYSRLGQLANEVPAPYAGGNTAGPSLSASQYADNLAIGLGSGVTNQVRDTANMVLHPVQTAKGLVSFAKTAVTQPRTVLDALAGYVKQGVTSGPMGFAQFVGENIGLPRSRAPVMREMTTYHGSPHDFDAFDMSKIGTGEGAQAYGHGLYFAERPGVAKTYQAMSPHEIVIGDQKITGKMGIAGRGDAETKAWNEVTAAYDGQHQNPFATAKQRLAGQYGPRNNVDSEAIAIINEWQRKGAVVRPGGKLYTVDIPDSAIANMLDWDAPLSQQPEAVRKALESAGVVNFDKNIGPSNGGVIRDLGWTKNVGSLTGERVYKNLVEKFQEGKALTTAGRKSAEAEVSAFMAQYGIPGIKYYDGGSRSAGQGTRNFVVFDDKLPKILKKE